MFGQAWNYLTSIDDLFQIYQNIAFNAFQNQNWMIRSEVLNLNKLCSSWSLTSNNNVPFTPICCPFNHAGLPTNSYIVKFDRQALPKKKPKDKVSFASASYHSIVLNKQPNKIELLHTGKTVCSGHIVGTSTFFLPPDFWSLPQTRKKIKLQLCKRREGP